MRIAALALLACFCGCTARRFPNVPLTTQDNRQVRFYDDLVKGKAVMITFMFTRCQGVCPRATANLLKVRDALAGRLGRDVFLYSITLDPARDTPAVLHRYATSIAAGPGWLFLTGRPADLDLLRHKLGAYDLNPSVDADITQHGAMLLYGNDTLDRWAMIPSLSRPELILAAVRKVIP